MISLFLDTCSQIIRIGILFDNKLVELLVNGCIAVGLSIVPIFCLIVRDKDFRYYAKSLLKRQRQ